MPFGSGSKSAQTPSESSQQSPSNTKGALQAAAAGLSPGMQYRVFHKWRKVGSVAKKGMPHHSQIFIVNAVDQAVRDFGLFADDNGNVVYQDDPVDQLTPYHTSTSYAPNPCIATGAKIEQAIASASLKCGPNYKLLHNNCQKFARLFMIALGSSHSRELFHP
jgi:hypothetical protein